MHESVAGLSRWGRFAAATTIPKDADVVPPGASTIETAGPLLPAKATHIIWYFVLANLSFDELAGKDIIGSFDTELNATTFCDVSSSVFSFFGTRSSDGKDIWLRMQCWRVVKTGWEWWFVALLVSFVSSPPSWLLLQAAHRFAVATIGQAAATGALLSGFLLPFIVVMSRSIEDTSSSMLLIST